MAAEQLRRLLLKEMGITSWFPRAPLPGAALSHEQCLQNFFDDVPVPAQAPVSAPLSGSVDSRPAASGRPAVAQLAELLVRKPADPPAAVSAATPAVPPQTKPALQPTAQAETQQLGFSVPAQPMSLTDSTAQSDDVGAFGFSWFNVDNRLAVLTMLPAGNSRLTSSCRQMLARLLAALYTPWQTLELTEQSFHWPFADDLGLPADAAAARQAVDGFIARRLREQNCAMLLVLCDGLPWFFAQSTGTDPAAALRESALQVHRQFGFAMLATHSLHSMEKDAGLKREAWQSMQLLRERLNRNN